jgi:hypothetical protein
LIICPGDNVNVYQNKINEYINSNDLITIGCNNVGFSLAIDFHMWLDYKAFGWYGKNTNKNSRIVFSERVLKEHGANNFHKNKDIILKLKRKNYLFKKYNNKNIDFFVNKSITHLKISKNFIYGPFETTGSIAIAWAHIEGAKKIEIIGMDGYTFNSKKDLDKGIKNKHSYEKGYSRSCQYDNYSEFIKEKKINDNNYNYYKKVDKKSIRTLFLLKKYGIKFNILTPSVFREFYNPKMLNIK